MQLMPFTKNNNATCTSQTFSCRFIATFNAHWVWKGTEFYLLKAGE